MIFVMFSCGHMARVHFRSSIFDYPECEWCGDVDIVSISDDPEPNENMQDDLPRYHDPSLTGDDGWCYCEACNTYEGNEE